MTLRRLFDRAWAASEQRSWTKGLLGRLESDGSYTVAVADRPGFYYVRVAAEGVQSITSARNLAQVAARANLPVRMRLEDGVWTIRALDGHYYDSATGADTSNPYGVAPHTHAIGTGLEYEIEAQRLEPGRVYPYSGMTVYIGAFRYWYLDGWTRWLGGTIDLTSVQPATVGEWAWVMVGVNSATGASVAVAGDSQLTSIDLLPYQMDQITWPVGYIPCGAVKVKESDTALSDYSRFADARQWLGGADNLFNDSEATPVIEPVVTSSPTAGLSSYSARRDHVHAITDDAVTNAKMANMSQATIKGRAAGAGTGDPTDLTASQVATIVNASIDHGTLAGLTDDDHANYARLGGRSGGQSIEGGLGASEDLVLESTAHATAGNIRMAGNGGNVGIGPSAPYGSGDGVIGLANAATNPSATPTGGVVIWADSGAAKVRGTSGTTTTFGPAEPHCPACGSDYMLEFDGKWGYMALCVKCLAAHLGVQPWIIK